MRRQMFIFASTALIALIALSATPSQAAVCEPSTETRQSLKRLEIQDPARYQRLAEQKAILTEMLAQHPDDVFLHLEYIDTEAVESEAARTAVIARYKELAAAHPANLDFAFLYAYALQGVDTPDAIVRLKALASGSPAYPLASRQLAKIYSWGKFTNHDESRSQLDAYFDACPASFFDKALNLLAAISTQEMANRYAPALRERLMKDSDPDRIVIWRTIWTLEFKTKPPAEHAEIRKQVEADLARIDASPPTSDVRRLQVFLAGYKKLDDEPALRNIEDRIIAADPSGTEAQNILDDRWSHEHPYPKPGDPKATQQAFYRAELQYANQLLKASPNDSYLLRMRFSALAEIDDSSTKQMVEAAKAYLAAQQLGSDWWYAPPIEFTIADAYIKRRTHVTDVPTLVAAGCVNFADRPELRLTSDITPDDLRKDFAEELFSFKTDAARILLDAAQQLKQPAIAKAAMDSLADAKPDKPSVKSTLWALKAKWAELNGHKLDAMLMYRAALDARPASEKPDGDDDLAANFARLRDELGGTADTEKLLAKASRPLEAVTQGRWEVPTKDMPAWELPDLTGRNWTAASLHGKTVLINVWATWCGPCRMEHPALEALYEKIKDRSDVQIVTFNIDEAIGDVAPYMSKNKYTFPVLLAKDYIDDLLPSIGIPMIWIVDASGKWRWEQDGYGDDAKWETTILEKLDHTKPQ